MKIILGHPFIAVLALNMIAAGFLALLMVKNRKKTDTVDISAAVIVLTLSLGITWCLLGYQQDDNDPNGPFVLLASLLGAVTTTVLGLITLLQNKKFREIEAKMNEREELRRNTPELFCLDVLEYEEPVEEGLIVTLKDKTCKKAYRLIIQNLEVPVLNLKVKRYQRINPEGPQIDYRVKNQKCPIQDGNGDEETISIRKRNEMISLILPKDANKKTECIFVIILEYQNIFHQKFNKKLSVRYSKTKLSILPESPAEYVRDAEQNIIASDRG